MSVRASLIISTYNKPAWLQRTLWGVAAQTARNFEVIIADDGSGAETAAVIEAFRAESGVTTSHVWQEDRGFRKCEILNRAIHAARADYVIFTDGDCVQRSDFIETHLRLASPRCFLSGGQLRISQALGESLTRDDIASGRLFDPAWLRARGASFGTRQWRLTQSSGIATLLDQLTTTPPRFDGGNASVWRQALFDVNGFDAEMGYGWEDRALGERLRNLGFRGKQIRNRAISFHIDHARPYRNDAEMHRNLAIYRRIIRNREIRAKIGLQELLSAAPDKAALPEPRSAPSIRGREDRGDSDNTR